MDSAVAAISICEGNGDRTGVALAASDETDDFPKNNIRSWLMDTGCKHDLTTRDAIPYCQLGIITKSQSPVLLSTANDIISIDLTVPQQIGALGVNAEPYVLDQSLDVLSIWATLCPGRI